MTDSFNEKKVPISFDAAKVRDGRDCDDMSENSSMFAAQLIMQFLIKGDALLGGEHCHVMASILNIRIRKIK